MKLSEIARYWAAKELTRIEFDVTHQVVELHAPFACEEFTLSVPTAKGVPRIKHIESQTKLQEADSRLKLEPGLWCREKDRTLACFKLEKGVSMIEFMA
jgi:hypothetical protein